MIDIGGICQIYYTDGLVHIYFAITQKLAFISLGVVSHIVFPKAGLWLVMCARLSDWENVEVQG